MRHGRRQRLRLAVSNRGTATAAGARLTITLAKGLKLVSARGCKVKKRRVTCALGDLQPGASAQRTLVVRAKHRGRFKLKAKATSTSADAHPADNSRSVALRVR